MAREILRRGSESGPNDFSLPNDSWWVAAGKINDMTEEIYALQSQTINAGAVIFQSAPTIEGRIQLAIAAAVSGGFGRVYIPESMLPYDASLVTFDPAIQMVREGGSVDVYDVKAYGASDDGVTPATTAFIAAMAGAAPRSGTVYVPDATTGYLWTEVVITPTTISIAGGSKVGTRIIHGYNGTMLQLAMGVRMENLWFDGNGATFSGDGFQMFAGGGKQTVRSCKITDFTGTPIHFMHEAAGSQSYWEDVEAWHHDGTLAGQEAIVVSGSLTALANPRTFVGLQTQGKKAVDLGPCNNFFLSASRPGDIVWNNASKGVTITGCRLGGTAAMTILGANHAICGNDIGPAVTVGAGCTQVTLKGNTYNNLPIVDAAFSQTNVIEDQKEIDRTVSAAFIAFTASDATPSIGQGKNFQTTNSSSTTITTFDDGVEGQSIMVRFDVNTGLTHNNSVMRLKGGSSIAVGGMTANNFIAFIRMNSIWWETFRNF